MRWPKKLSEYNISMGLAFGFLFGTVLMAIMTLTFIFIDQNFLLQAIDEGMLSFVIVWALVSVAASSYANALKNKVKK